jgi:hypothetical protein
MKAKLEFDLDDFGDRKAHKRCVSATNAYIALNKIAEEVFRPNRKHGYGKEIEDLFDALGDDAEIVTEIVDKLETKFYNIIEELGLDLDDLE